MKAKVYEVTPFGTALIYEDGSAYLTGTPDETYAWATRPNATWPCSKLSGNPIGAKFAPNGDLVEIMCEPDDMDGHELTAWSSDVLAISAPWHPARRGLCDWSALLIARGWDAEPYIAACRGGDVDLVAMHHPINFMTETEAEESGDEIYRQLRHDGLMVTLTRIP